jgi:radical SAM superfamily enzyme YgiQ (UPF0313 family)
MKIYLCDLSHLRDGIFASEMIPYPIGCIKSYFHAYAPIEAEITLFKSPAELSATLENDCANKTFPKIIGFSCYMWNHNLSLVYAREIKKLSTETLVVFGGPDFPLEITEKKTWLSKRPEIDFFIEGEGEKPFLELAMAFNNSQSIKLLKTKDPLDSTFCLIDETLKFKAEIARDGFIKSPRIENLDLTPSPYLMGYLDKFLQNDKLVPLMESNRGCPFTCTFCVDGNAARTKVFKVNPNRLADELEYIAQRTKGKTLALADTNFGMFKEDIVFSKLIAKVKDKYNYPQYINTSTGKNQKERIIECAELLKGTMRVAASVQSLDKQVLLNIKRSNISENELISIATRLNGGVANTYSELILALPGDTKEKHFDSLNKCIDAGYNQIRMHTLTLLDGSVLGTKEERDKYTFVTKHRLLQRCFGTYILLNKKINVTETEEVVISQQTLSEDDYYECRLYNMCVAIFFNENIFFELNTFLRIKNLKVSEWISTLPSSINLDSGPIGNLFKRFIRLTKDELFDSKAEIVNTFESDDAFVSTVEDGKFGFNLLLDTQGEILIYHVNELVKLAFESARNFINSKSIVLSSDEIKFLEQLEFVMKTRRHNIFDNKSEQISELEFDFESICNNGYSEIPRVTNSKNFVFFFPPERTNFINDQLRLYGDSPQGIGKIIARSPMKDFQRTVKAAAS